MLITGPGTEYVLGKCYYYYCNYYLNTIRITTLHLDFSPRLWPKGRPAFAFPWDAGRSEPLDSGLGFWVYKVRISHGLIDSLRTFTLSHLLGEAWIQPVNFAFPNPSLCPGEELDFQSLAKASSKWLSDCILWGASGRRSVRGRGKLCQLLSCFLRQCSSRVPVLACSQRVPLNPDSKSVLLLKRLRTFQKTATEGNYWDARSLAGVIQ